MSGIRVLPLYIYNVNKTQLLFYLNGKNNTRIQQLWTLCCAGSPPSICGEIRPIHDSVQSHEGIDPIWDQQSLYSLLSTKHIWCIAKYWRQLCGVSQSRVYSERLLCDAASWFDATLLLPCFKLYREFQNKVCSLNLKIVLLTLFK